MTPNKTFETAKHAGFCYYCGLPIYIGDKIFTWDEPAPIEGSNKLAVHARCYAEREGKA